MTLTRTKYAAICLVLLVFATALIIYPERYVECCLNGFLMWAECVLPSLFPFMIVALIFIKTGIAERASYPLKRVCGFFNLPPAAAACVVISLFSGYPAGSRTLFEFYGRGTLTKSDVEKLSYICSSSSPAFIIGSVGFKMFGDKYVGIKILAAHICVILITGLTICLFSKKAPENYGVRAPADKNVLWNTFYGAIISVAVAGGFIAFFFTLTKFISDFRLLYPLEIVFTPLLGENAPAFLSGLIEATTGCAALAAAGKKLSYALAGFLITFGGISILLQQLSYLTQAGVRSFKFIAVKFLQGILCFLILLALP